MYVMAAGTGSALEGAKMLFTFGIGTLPVLLSFGVLTGLISAALTHQLLRASGAILILLGAVMINRGLILTGTGYDLQSVMTLASSKLGLAQTPHPASSAEGDLQIISMEVTKSGYEPNHFVLRGGVRVKWIIDGKEITECNRRIVVPKLGLEFDVKEGVQTIEFTPKGTGGVFIPWRLDGHAPWPIRDCGGAESRAGQSPCCGCGKAAVRADNGGHGGLIASFHRRTVRSANGRRDPRDL